MDLEISKLHGCMLSPVKPHVQKLIPDPPKTVMTHAGHQLPLSARWSPLSEYFCPQCCRMPVPSSIFSHQRPNLHTNEHLNGLDDIIDLQLEIFLSRSLRLGRIKCAK